VIFLNSEYFLSGDSFEIKMISEPS